MSDGSIFADEEKTIEEAEEILAACEYGDHPLVGRYAELLKKYKKLYSQTRRMIRMSDRMQKELNLLTEKLDKLSYVDKLTGVANRRYFDESFEKEWLRAGRRGEPIGLLMIDIDYFKKYNDFYGHIEGDNCLGLVAGAIESSLKRPEDFVTRYGGEEFVVVLPTTDCEGAVHVAERILSTVGKLAIKHEESPISGQVTISIGVSSIIPSSDKSCKHLLAASDSALYEAKRQGRNRIWSTCRKESP